MRVNQGIEGRAFQWESRASVSCLLLTRLDMAVKIAESGSALGPLASLQGSVVLPGFQARVTFRDQPRSDAAAQENTILVPLVLPGDRLERPRMTVRGAPRRPVLTMRLLDAQGTPLSEERTIGECADGSHPVSATFKAEASAVAWLDPSGWSDQGGPRFQMNGKLSLVRGVTVRLGFGHSGESRRIDDGAAEVPLVIPGATYFFTEKTVEAGLTGEPWIWLRFFDQEGGPLGPEQLVGHCLAA